MLLRFQVTNHASIRDEQELSLIAGDDRGARAQRPVPGAASLKAVPVAAIYGSNASGKSNLVDAMSWMRRAVLDSFRRWDPSGGVPRRPFRLRPDPQTHPSTYELDFVVDGIRYEFGFTVDDACVLEEWLACFPEGKRRALYTRTGSDPASLSFGRSLTGRRKTISDLLRPNSLYLSVAAAQNHELLGRLHRWFRNGMRTATDGNFAARLDYTVGLLRRRDTGSSTLVDLLRFADLGVEHLEFSRHDEKYLAEYKRVTTALSEALGRPVKNDGPEYRVTVQHRTEEGVFDLELNEESSGTRTWIGMLGPVLGALAAGSVLAVDELDARLHPYLADALVGMFQNADLNRHGAQLVFTTHEASLLGPHARTELSRDQVWFTEKPLETLATRLFPITDFYVRDSPDSRDNLERRYLSGRYGALPHLDDELLRRVAADTAEGGAGEAGEAVGTEVGETAGVA
ncbi:hypothetical protein BIV57_12895 [Mangrovactinospora gilvigrisea]|uniref:ATPase AAA-type core domain-containing protein n=1 Tax=Mangrovactinospora gilvigrisea TaxID=1428644 RepID=A0A1J7CBN5_9ACTN|nr:ATP-binding protein [Mangrovactinospora gilvigrisea]OIV37058.1 hypothetical protein BIV57_12895 [Mangrovactinospora gilvigrisea]